MIIVGNGLATVPFGCVCGRGRPCAVPVNHVAEGDKPLPYENDQAKVDTLALFRLVVFAEGDKPLPYERN